MKFTSSQALINKKVVFMFGNLELGGAEKQGLLLATHLKGIGAHVQVVGLNDCPGRLAKLCQDTGIPWRTLTLGPLKSRIQRFIGLVRFIREMRQEHPYLLISYTKKANILSALAWRILGARAFIWNQADEGLGMKRTIINLLAVSLTSYFISNSSGGRLFLQNMYKIRNSNVAVIHNGISLAPAAKSRQDWRKTLGISEESFVATMVANITRFKDHQTLLKAWKIVVNAFSAQAVPVLLLAGRFDGPEHDLMKLVSQLGIGNNVQFLGEVSDVTGLLEASDLFVYSSVSEGLPNGVLEAMAAGLPVVATDIPGIREAVGPAGTAFLSPVHDASVMAEKIQMFINSVQLCRNHGRILKERADKEFCMTTMMETSVKFIEQVLS